MVTIRRLSLRSGHWEHPPNLVTYGGSPHTDPGPVWRAGKIPEAPSVRPVRCRIRPPALPQSSCFRGYLPGASSRAGARRIVIGYSGHEQGITPSPAAAALDAAIIERHFTTDDSLRGSDQRYSLAPQATAELVEGVSVVRRSRETSIKRRHPSEESALHKLSGMD